MPTLGQDVELLCFPQNSDANNCYVTETINLPLDFTYTTTKNLYFTRSTLNCVTNMGIPCSIHIIIQGRANVYLLSNTTFQGKQVVIENQNASIIIDATSKILVAGKSPELTGTASNQGASFIGDGGYCGPQNKWVPKSFSTYSSIPILNSTKPNVIMQTAEQIGSMGQSNDVSTYGGGRIVLVCDNLNLQGTGLKLAAHGYPLKETSTIGQKNGGSGGYIYVKTLNVRAQNMIQAGALVSVNGGYGVGGGMGGAGGMIVLENIVFSSEYISADPGAPLNNDGSIDTMPQSGCKYGAPGTVYSRNLDVLTVNVNGNFTQKGIYLNGTSGIVSVKTLDLKAFAKITLRQANNLVIGFQFRSGLYSSILFSPTNNGTNMLKLGMVSTFDPTTIIWSPSNSLQINGSSPYTFNAGEMAFGKQLTIVANSININSTLSPVKGIAMSSIYLKATLDINLRSSKIQAADISILAGRNLTINSSGNPLMVSTLFLVNQTQPVLAAPYTPDPVNYDLYLGANGTLSILNSANVTMTGGLIGFKVGAAYISGPSFFTSTSLSIGMPAINIFGTQIVSFSGGLASFIGSQLQVIGDGVNFFGGLSFNNKTSAISGIYTLIQGGNRSVQIAGPSYIKSNDITLSTNGIVNGSIYLTSSVLTSSLSAGTITIKASGSGNITVDGASSLSGLQLEMSAPRGSVSVLGSSNLSFSGDLTQTYDVAITANQSATIYGSKVVAPTIALVCEGDISINMSSLDVGAQNPLPNLKLVSSQGALNIQQTMVTLASAYSSIQLQGEVLQLSGTQVSLVKSNVQVQALSSQSYSGYSLIINVTGNSSTNDFYQESSQIISPNMMLYVASGNLRVLGDLNKWQLTGKASAIQGPTLFVTAAGQSGEWNYVAIVNTDIEADQINITSGGSLALQYSNMTGQRANQVQGMHLEQSIHQGDTKVFLKSFNGLTQFQHSYVSCETLYVEQDILPSQPIPGGVSGIEIIGSIFNVQTSPTVTYPSLVLISNSTILFDSNNQINASSVYLWAQNDITSASQAQIDLNVYVNEFAAGKIPSAELVQLFIKSRLGSIRLSGISAKSYHTMIKANQEVILTNSSFARFTMNDNNAIYIEGQKLVQLNGFQSASGNLLIMNDDGGVSMSDLFVTVSSESYLSELNGTASFNVISTNSSVTITGDNNRYNCRDLSIQSGTDTTISNMVMMLTVKANAPSPAVRFEVGGSLTFTGPAFISGGYMQIVSMQGITFLDQASLLSTRQSESLGSDQGLKLSAGGSIECKTNCTFSSESPVSIQAAGSISGNGLIVMSDQNVSLPIQAQPSLPTLIVNASSGALSFPGVLQLSGIMIQVTAATGIVGGQTIINSYLGIAPSKNTDAIYISSPNGVSQFSGGFISGSTVSMRLESLIANDLVIQATVAQPLYQHNVHINLTGNFTSQRNFTVLGGQLLLKAIGEISAYNGFQMHSDPALILPPTVSSGIRLKKQGDPYVFPVPVEDAELAITSQNVILIQQGNISANSTLYIYANTRIGQVRLTDTNLSTNYIVEIEAEGDLFYVGNCYALGLNIWVQSGSLMQISDGVEFRSISGGLFDNSTHIHVYARNAFQSRDFSILNFYTINILSNNSIILGRGVYKCHDFDVKARAYLKTSNLSVSFSNSAFLNSYNVTVKNSSYLLNIMQAGISNKTSLRFLALYYLQIIEKSVAKAHNIFMKGSASMSIMDSTVESLIYSQCFTGAYFDEPLFNCVPKSSLDKDMSEARFIAAFNQHFQGLNVTLINQTFPYIEDNFTAYLLSYGQISVYNSLIAGSSVGTCSRNFLLHQTNLTSSGRGCAPGQGLGAGIFQPGCAGSGAGQAGIGSPGATQLDADGNIMAGNCSFIYPTGIPSREIDTMYYGSGGATALVNGETNNITSGGVGGGVIWISTSNRARFDVNSMVRADGQSGYILPTTEANLTDPTLILPGSGGGSGGSIQIITKNLDGNGVITARGGSGSVGGGGAGSGGRIVLYFLGNYLSDFWNKNTYNWTGSVDIRGGRNGQINPSQWRESTLRASNGTEWNPQCLGGYSGSFCPPCPVGTYKYGYSYGRCEPCQNAPVNAFYTEKAVSTYYCPYECKSGLEPVSLNPDCLSNLELQVSRIMGNNSYAIGFLAVVLVVILIQWICLIYHKGKVIKACDPVEAMKVDLEAEDDSDKGGFNATAFLRYHTYRLYFMGFNSPKLPWIVPTDDIPQSALSQANLAKLDDMLTKNKNTLLWSFAQTTIFSILQILLPPLAVYYQSLIKRSKLRILNNLMQQTFDEDFWGNHVSNQSLRVTAESTEKPSLGYIDFVDFAKTLDTEGYSGPRLPVVSMISGRGTLEDPYHLDYQNDPYLKSLSFLNRRKLRKQLPLFMANLNAHLAKLNFHKFSGLVLRDLDTLLYHLQMGNKKLFNPAGAKVTLYLFDNVYNQTTNEQVKRKSLPIDSYLFQAFPGTFELLISYIKYKIMRMTPGFHLPSSKQVELRFGLVFQRFSESKQRKQEQLEELISTRKASIKQTKGNNNDDKSEGLLLQSDRNQNFSIQEADFDEWLSDGSDYEGEFTDEKPNQHKQLVGIQDEDTSTKQGDESRRGSIRLRPGDNRKRAFSLSKNSAVQLGASLKKPRNGTKHSITRISAVLYSIYLMLFKMQVKPPKQSDGNYLLYFTLALLVTTDLVVTMSFIFHLAYPDLNMSPTTVAFLFIYPGLPIIGPIIGILSTLTGSVKLMRWHIMINAWLCLVNYPITIMTQVFSKSEAMFFVLEILILYLLKILIQFVSARARADMENPHFDRNHAKIKEIQVVQKESLNKTAREEDTHIGDDSD